jgi:hypothetical protein
MTIVFTMPEIAQKRMLELYRNGGAYLEYGSGGSTIAALNSPSISSVISVDTSADWLNKIIENISSDCLKKFTACHIEVGVLMAWGRPKSESHIKNWKNYIYKPWFIQKSKGISPNLVLIDGRFRIACFYASVFFSKPGTKILIDDYVDRTNYHQVEKILPITNLYGRLAEFTVPTTKSDLLIFNMLDTMYDSD